MSFAVHVFTAAGAGCAMLALLDAAAGSWPQMFAWLGAALAIDGIDGTLARRCDVARRLPNWSGESLDFVVDFSTYVFVPAYAIAAADLMPAWLAVAAALVIVITGALYFADRRMKTSDNYFRGFPAVWNLVAFYLLLVRPPGGITAMLVALLAILTFVPMPFIHPVRVKRLRPLNIALTALWAVLALAALVNDLKPPGWVVAALCAIGAYMFVAGLFRSWDRP